MKTRKRLFAAILALVMILSTLPVSAAGENAPSAKGAGIPGLKEIKISASPRRPDRSYHLGDMGTASAVWEEDATARDIVWSVETPDDTVEIAINQSSGEFTVMKAQLPPGGEEGIVSCTIKATVRIDGTDYTATAELEVYRSHALPLSPYRSLVVRDRKLLAKPKKTTYEAGEYLDLTGMAIEFTYSKGKWTSINGADCDFLCEGWDEIEKRPLELTDKQLVIVPDHPDISTPVYIKINVNEGEERPVELDVGSNGTASVSPLSAKPGSDIKITAVPNEGYVLDKITWKPEDGSEKNITESASFTMLAKKAFVTVRFKPAPRTVRFMDGEEVLFSQAVEYGQQAAKPASDPEKNGCEFAGWYADPAYSQAFDFNQDIRSDTPVYAKFKMRTTMSIRVPDKPLDVEEWMDAYFTVSPDLNPTERIILLPDLFTVKAGDQDLGSFHDPVRAKPELMWSFTASELGVGTHTISVSYGGNDKYTGCSGSFTVNVIEKESMQVVDFSPQTAPVNTAYTVSGRILDESGNPIANKSMGVVNQVGYGVTGKTDQEGRFSVVMNRDIPSEHGKTIEIKVVSSANDSYKRLISPHSIRFVDGYTVTVIANPAEGGTVAGGGDYAVGTEVTVTATPKEGYVFRYWWDGKNYSNDPIYTFTVMGEISLIAYFDKLVNVSVTASPAEGGTVTGGGIYTASMVPVTATANPGYVFAGWYDGDKLKSYNARYDLPVGSSDKNLTARFVRVDVNVVDEDGYPVDTGVYTVRLIADQGYIFGYSYTGLMVRVQIDYPSSNWVITRIEGAYSSFGTNSVWTDIVDGGGNQDLYSDLGRYDFTMPDGPVTITVTLYYWQPDDFWIALNASPREGGDVFGGGNHFLPGEPVELIAFPNPGYQFVGWTENGEQVSTDNPYIFPVTGYRTLTARFKRKITEEQGGFQVLTLDVSEFQNHSSDFVYLSYTEFSDTAYNKSFPLDPSQLSLYVDGVRLAADYHLHESLGPCFKLDGRTLPAGEHSFQLRWAGDEGYAPHDSNVYRATHKMRVRAVYDNPSGVVYRGEDYVLRLLEDQTGTPLKNSAVTLTLNGVDYTKTTDDEGFAKLNIEVDPGEYTITATYQGDETHYPLNQAYPVQVRWRVRMIKEYASPIYSGQGEGFKVRLLDDKDGTPIGSGRIVSFTVNGVNYTRETDEEGVALVKINLPPGMYSATASFEGQQLSDTFEVRSRVRVVTYDLAKAYGSPDQFKATLLDDIDETPVAGKTVQFNINGVFYKKVSNDDGVAALPIRLLPGEYIITTTYNGIDRANRVIVTESIYPPQPRYAVSVSISPGEGGQVSGGGDFAGGESATLTAAPNEGYRFVGWSRGGVQVSSDNPYRFTVTENRYLTAVFQERSASCTVKAGFAPLSLSGHIQVSGAGTYPEGSQVTLTASPAGPENWTFLGWVDNASNTIISRENPYHFTVLQDMNLTAVFGAGSAPLVTSYPLWIGDTQVDEANKDDIPGVTGENAKASFDPATNTLTLENVTGVSGSTMGALITAEGIDLTVAGSAVLEDNTVDMGIQVAPGSLTLEGDFTITAGSYGIYVQKNVTMVGGRLFAKGGACGIYSARGELMVKSGTLEAEGSMWALGTAPDLSGYTGEYEVLVKENYNAAAGASPWDGDFNHNPLGGSSSLYKYVKIAPRSSQPAEKYHINIVAPPEVTLSYTALSEDGAWGNPKYDTPIAEAAAGQVVLVFAQVDQSHYDFAGSDTLRLLGSNQILQDWNNPATHIFLNYFEMPANDVTVVILPVRKTNDGMGEMARCCIWLDGDESILDEQWIYAKNMPAPEKLENKTGKVPVKADDAGGSYVFDHWDYEQEGDWRITFKPVFSSAPVGVPSCKLLSITADGGTLEPVFDPEVTAYTITVPYETEEIGLVAEDDNCLRIDESEWKPNSLQLSYNPVYPTEIIKAEGRIALEVGENVVHLTASYINGVFEETEYTVTIKRAAPPPRTVTFQVINGSWEDGSDKKQLTVPEGTKLTAAEIPAGTPDSGYGAGAWDLDPVGQTVSGDVTFTWTYRHFKIRYEMVGDAAIGTPPAERQTEWWGTESREVLGGSALLVRPAILNEQYDFGGIWYTDQACTQQADGWAALDGDVTLYGAWTGPYNTVINQVMLNFVPPVAGDPIPAGQYYADGIGAGIPAELGVTQPGSMDDKTLVYFAAYELEGGEEEAVFEAGKTYTLRVILGLADPLSQRFKGHGGGTPYALSVTGAEGSIASVTGTQTEVQLTFTPREKTYGISAVSLPSEAGSISFADALAGGNAITAAKAGETIYIILPQAGGGYMALDLVCQGDTSGKKVTVDMFKINDRIYRASFMMPEEPVTVTARFADISTPRKISVVCEPEGAGTAAASQEEGVYGDMIRLTASAQEGWLFDKWQIVSGAGADLVSVYGLEGHEEHLRMGYEDVSLKALFVEDTRPIVHITLEAPLCGVRPSGADSLPSGAPVYTYQTPRPEATLLTQGWSFATYAENGDNWLGWSGSFTGWSSNVTFQSYPFKGGGTYTVYGKLISDGSEDLSQGVRVFANGREGAARVSSGGIVTFYVTVEAVHDWDEPQYDWAGDDSSVSGKVCCRNAACGETLQETVNTTMRITAQATETACAEMSYTAVFTQQPFTTQTKTVLIPKTPLNLGLTISGWTEGEKENQPLLSGNDGNGAVTYSYRLAADPDEEASYRAGLPAVAGDYVLRARVAETVTHQAGEAFAAFTISRAKFTVTYVVENGSWGDGTTTVKTEEVEEGQNPAQIPTGMLPAVNYEGGSWDTDPSGAVITDHATFTYSFTEQKPPAPPKTVFTITFDLDGGTWDGQTGSVSLKVEDGTDIILPEPEKAGHTFDYWEGSRYNAGDRYTVGGDHTFTARWKQNSVTPGGDQPGGDQPGGDQPGGDQPGGDQPGGDQPGGNQPGGDQPGGDQPGGDQPGGDQPGGDQPGGDQPGGDQPGGDQPGGDQPGGDQPGGDQPGGDQPGGDQPGGDQPGGDQPGGDQPGGDQPGGDQPGGDQPGGNQPGGDQPGGDQPGGDQPGGDQPGGDQPGGDQPGGDQPGGDQPGGDQPGGDQPGGNEPGGDQPGGDQPGGDQPGGDQPGGDQPGGDQPGGDQPGGDQPGGDQPGGDQPGGDQPGGDQPGGDQPGGDQPGGDQPGGDQPGGDQPGGDQPGGDQPGGDQPGGDQPGGDQPGGDQPGGDQPGGDQPGGDQPGGDQPGGDQPGGDQPGGDQPGGDQPGGNQPGGDQPGGDQPGGDEPGSDQPGGNEPGGDQPGGDQPGGDQPGGDQPGGDQPGGDQPGGDQPGGDQPGGDQPGGDQPGGDQPGGDQPGGDQPGGDQPGGDEPGGNQPGGDQPGGDQPGGDQPGGDEPGGDQPGGDQPGGDQPGGDQPGGDQPGGDQPGGDQPGGDQPGGDQPGGDQPGGDQPGGDQPGGDQPGGDQPGGDQPGGDQPGGDQPGGDQPGGDQPGGDEPGGDQPGGDQPGGDQPGGDQPGGDEPGGDQPGGDQPGGDQPGGDQPGGDQPGGDQPGGDQPGGDQPGGDQPGGDQPGGDQPGGNEPGGNEPGGNEPGGNEPGGNEPGGNEPGGNEPGGNEPGGDQPGGDEPGGNEPGGSDPTQEEPAQEEPTQEEPTQEEPTQEDPTQEEPTQEEPAQEEPTQEDPTQEEPTQEDPTQEAPTQEDPTQNMPGKSIPAMGDGNSLTKWIALMSISLLGLAVIWPGTDKKESKRRSR